MIANRCKDCGHDARQHIYHEGACRPGLSCPCRVFVPDDKPATADNSRDLCPICGLGSAECITRPDLHRIIATLRAERDELRGEAASWRATASDKGLAAREIAAERDELRAALEHIRDYCPDLPTARTARNALTKGSNDE